MPHSKDWIKYMGLTRLWGIHVLIKSLPYNRLINYFNNGTQVMYMH